MASSELAGQPVEASQMGHSTPVSNAEPLSSNVRIEDGISPLSEVGSASLEDYLHERARSNRQCMELSFCYNYFKNDPGTELFLELIFFNDVQWLQALADRPAGTEITFAELIGTLERALLQPSSSSLRLCFLLDTIPPLRAKSRFRFGWRIFGYNPPTIKFSQSPILAILYTVMSKWHFNIGVINSWATERTSIKATQTRLPSTCLQSVTAPSILESAEWTYTHLYWFQDITPYLSDLYVYIWQPHLGPVLPLGATICVGPLNSNQRNLLIYYRPSKHTRGPYDIYKAMFSSIPASLERCSNMSVKIFCQILAIYGTLIVDTAGFIDSVGCQIEKVWEEGKRKPSVDKMNYALYLSECLKSCSHSLAEALLLLDKLSDSQTVPEGSEDTIREFDEWRSTLREDIQYLAGLLPELDSRISMLRTMIREQLDLRQFRLSTPLTILAAIYLPFSFASAFFGMNLRNPLWYSPSPPTEGFNSTFPTNGTKSLGFTQNHTNSVVDALSSSGPHLFTLKEFLLVACILTIITLGLPFLGVRIFWGAVRWLKRYKYFWNVLVLILVYLYTLSMLMFLFRWRLFFVGIPLICFGFLNLVFEQEYLVQLRVRLKVRWSKKWIIFNALAAACLSDPLFLPFWVPPSFLFGAEVFERTGRHFRLLSFLNRLVLKISSLGKQYKKIGIGILAALCVISSTLACFWSWLITIFFGVYTSLYGVDKLRAAVRLRKSVIEWAMFLIIVGGCFASDLLFRWSLTLPTVPLLYRVLYRLCVNDQEFITMYLPDWMNFRKGRPAETIDLENRTEN